ncbi:hypothetical protein DASC09_007210 [Saccharomycopsis crataegensis]|uniref:L-2-hydroxyglutarate dehydrogenase, mitochondrial n=1 Tax=Saccharomycopsis crataegensis TaxID=43959 RepID=A0AAV5QF85_9ASCO|nr:hypothetical protein DASC09_007210 [Saccharomycopsis crataegensis]
MMSRQKIFKSLQKQIRLFSSTSVSNADYSHVVIGGGAVGIAIAGELSKRQDNNVLIIEKNDKLGQETSSRNSEVIHAGLYYPIDSLKTKLCIEGSRLIYDEASRAGVQMSKVGKWIVAQNDIEDAYLEGLHSACSHKGIQTEFLSLHDAKYIEPAIVANRSILNSPNSGIVSAHSLMDYLYSIFQDNGGDLAVNSEVLGLSTVNKNDGSDGYEIQAKDTVTGEEITITSDVVINSAGLYSDKISNMLLPEDRHVKYTYAKGNYFTLTRSHLPVKRLIYPTPIKGLKGLGTHLTISLDGQIKFGPDHEIVSEIDYSPNSSNIPKAYEQIIKYYPGILQEDLVASYSGIRPQLPNPKGEFQDFIIRKEEGYTGFINLLNIDSPGLTSSMAIGKYVRDLLYK